MDEKLVEIRSYDGPGYRPQVDFEDWRVAILNFEFPPEAIHEVERHNLTDEVFVLIKGKGVLFVGSGAKRPDRLYLQVMEIGRIYNVRKAVWHATAMTRDASMLIVENRDT